MQWQHLGNGSSGLPHHSYPFTVTSMDHPQLSAKKTRPGDMKLKLEHSPVSKEIEDDFETRAKGKQRDIEERQETWYLGGRISSTPTPGLSVVTRDSLLSLIGYLQYPVGPVSHVLPAWIPVAVAMAMSKVGDSMEVPHEIGQLLLTCSLAIDAIVQNSQLDRSAR